MYFVNFLVRVDDFYDDILPSGEPPLLEATTYEDMNGANNQSLYNDMEENPTASSCTPEPYETPLSLLPPTTAQPAISSPLSSTLPPPIIPRSHQPSSPPIHPPPPPSPPAFSPSSDLRTTSGQLHILSPLPLQNDGTDSSNVHL